MNYAIFDRPDVEELGILMLPSTFLQGQSKEFRYELRTELANQKKNDLLKARRVPLGFEICHFNTPNNLFLKATHNEYQQAKVQTFHIKIIFQ